VLENTCYYTFSTVCQVLAGAFGFLVAVVLYRIQGIEHLIHENTHLANGWGIDLRGDFHDARKMRDWPAVARILRGIENPPNPQNRKSLDEAKEKFLALVDRLQAVKAELRYSLRLTGFTIAGSLALLPLTPLIACCNVLAGILMTVAVGAAGYCLLGYYKLAEGAAE
jgi:hypothetical protein